MYFSPFFTDSYDALTDGHAHRDPDKNCAENYPEKEILKLRFV